MKMITFSIAISSLLTLTTFFNANAVNPIHIELQREESRDKAAAKHYQKQEEEKLQSTTSELNSLKAEVAQLREQLVRANSRLSSCPSVHSNQQNNGLE